nr:DUF2267 domain-containing protein [Streptomyces sabulosicollis]
MAAPAPPGGRRGAPEGDTEQLIHAGLRALQRHISEGERHDLRGRMPADLVTVIPA